MAGECEYLTSCKFLQRFKDHPAVKEKDLYNKYCANWFDSEDCERKRALFESDCCCQPEPSYAPDGSRIKSWQSA